MRQDAPGRKIKEWRRGIVWALFLRKCSYGPRRSGKGSDDEGAVVGLTLRFALNARPTGSQGFAPGKANDKDKNKSKNGNKDREKRGHF